MELFTRMSYLNYYFNGLYPRASLRNSYTSSGNGYYPYSSGSDWSNWRSYDRGDAASGLLRHSVGMSSPPSRYSSGVSDVNPQHSWDAAGVSSRRSLDWLDSPLYHDVDCVSDKRRFSYAADSVLSQGDVRRDTMVIGRPSNVPKVRGTSAHMVWLYVYTLI